MTLCTYSQVQSRYHVRHRDNFFVVRSIYIYIRVYKVTTRKLYEGKYVHFIGQNVKVFRWSRSYTRTKLVSYLTSLLGKNTNNLTTPTKDQTLSDPYWRDVKFSQKLLVFFLISFTIFINCLLTWKWIGIVVSAREVVTSLIRNFREKFSL